MKRFVLAVLASALSLGVTVIPQTANADYPGNIYLQQLG